MSSPVIKPTKDKDSSWYVRPMKNCGEPFVMEIDRRSFRVPWNRYNFGFVNASFCFELSEEDMPQLQEVPSRWGSPPTSPDSLSITDRRRYGNTVHAPPLQDFSPGSATAKDS